MSLLALNPEENALAQQAADLSDLLERAEESHATMTGQAGDSIEIPLPIFELIKSVVGELRRGNGVVIMPVNKLLTTNQAAEVLNVSRPYLVRLLNEKRILFEYVGSHRRIRLKDLLAYQEERDLARERALADMVRRGEEADLPY